MEFQTEGGCGLRGKIVNLEQFFSVSSFRSIRCNAPFCHIRCVACLNLWSISMKRLTLVVLLTALIIAIIAFPAQAGTKNSTSQTQTQMVVHESRVTEKAEVSLAECPVWAQIVVVGVVILFALMAVVPFLVKEEKARFPYPGK